MADRSQDNSQQPRRGRRVLIWPQTPGESLKGLNSLKRLESRLGHHLSKPNFGSISMLTTDFELKRNAQDREFFRLSQNLPLRALSLFSLSLSILPERLDSQSAVP